MSQFHEIKYGGRREFVEYGIVLLWSSRMRFNPQVFSLLVKSHVRWCWKPCSNKHKYEYFHRHVIMHTPSSSYYRYTSATNYTVLIYCGTRTHSLEDRGKDKKESERSVCVFVCVSVYVCAVNMITSWMEWEGVNELKKLPWSHTYKKTLLAFKIANFSPLLFSLQIVS